jgi:hypothetical protein
VIRLGEARKDLRKERGKASGVGWWRVEREKKKEKEEKGA